MISALKRLVRPLPPFRGLIDRINAAHLSLRAADEALNVARAERDAAGDALTAARAECDAAAAEIAMLLAQHAQRYSNERIVEALYHFGLPDVAPVTPPPNARITDEFRSYYRDVLLRTFFRDWPHAAHETETFENDVRAHTEARYRLFADYIVPWIRTVQADLSQMTAVEIGSGTGASTLAFAEHMKKVVCFEIDDPSIEAARARLDYFGLSNVEFRGELFGPESGIVKRREPVHLIVLCAVLEHMTFDEAQTALKTAWDILEPGGLLVVADTPNRFGIFDGHTSLLPFFSALPPEIMKRYASYSPREAFRKAIEEAPADQIDERLTRWGRGISYHDFDLAIGPHFHDCIVLDGYEPTLRGGAPQFIDDALLRVAFAHYQIPASRAFTRCSLHFVARKP